MSLFPNTSTILCTALRLGENGVGADVNISNSDPTKKILINGVDVSASTTTTIETKSGIGYTNDTFFENINDQISFFPSGVDATTVWKPLDTFLCNVDTKFTVTSVAPDSTVLSDKGENGFGATNLATSTGFVLTNIPGGTECSVSFVNGTQTFTKLQLGFVSADTIGLFWGGGSLVIDTGTVVVAPNFDVGDYMTFASYEPSIVFEITQVTSPTDPNLLIAIPIIGTPTQTTVPAYADLFEIQRIITEIPSPMPFQNTDTFKPSSEATALPIIGVTPTVIQCTGQWATPTTVPSTEDWERREIAHSYITVLPTLDLITSDDVFFRIREE